MINFGNLKLNSIDYLFVVSRDYTIVYQSRFDQHMGEPNERINNDYVNRNFFEVYPYINKETSSIVKCMTTGEIVVKRFQKFVDYKGKYFCTHNVTMPIIREGQIVGVAEIAKDITTIDNLENSKSTEFTEDLQEITEYPSKGIEDISFDIILTQNPQMLKNIERAKFLATTPQPTLIYGETGTGKELFAQAMMDYSGVPKKKRVVQNCASVPEGLIESILFGTSKGAYTGAENRKGLFEEADGGIFFLDELNSLPYHVQGKLLRVLQDGTFRPVGSNVEKKVNVKVIAAMNEDPITAIEKQILRKDLFYRLSSGIIQLIPLRERKDDIEFYLEHYIRESNLIYNKKVTKIHKDLKEFFLEYSWDGNVRELKHVIESMVSISEESCLTIQLLPAYVYDKIYTSDHVNKTIEIRRIGRGDVGKSLTNNDSFVTADNLNLKETLEETEKRLIRSTLERTRGNKTKAAELLGIPRQTLAYKMNKFQI